MQHILHSLHLLFSFFHKEIDESEAKIAPDFIRDLHNIATFFNILPQVIYYPGCKNDITPKKAFPKARVYFLDKDKHAIASLRKAGCKYLFVRLSEHFHCPEQADMTLLIDFQLDDASVRNTKKGGLIICNDHYDVASKLYTRDDCELVGVVTEHGVDDIALCEYFQTATTDADLRRAGVYNLYRKSIEKINPEIEDVMSFIRRDYQKIMGTDTYLGVALGVARGDVQKVLPRKRGAPDSASGWGMISNVCVFKKK